MKKSAARQLATNNKALFDYEILEKVEAGLVLLGHEVKSVKLGHISLKATYVAFTGDEAWLVNAHISPYKAAGKLEGYEATRSRKLLLHKKEVDRLRGKIQEQGLTVVPLSVYTSRSRIKVELGLARGKKKHEKKEKIKRRDVEKEMKRTLKNQNTGDARIR